MFSIFETEHGALIIRTQDIRRLSDQQSGKTVVVWVEVERADTPQSQIVKGTARENFERLKREEIEAVDAAQKAQQRSGKGLPMLPVGRGALR